MHDPSPCSPQCIYLAMQGARNAAPSAIAMSDYALHPSSDQPQCNKVFIMGSPEVNLLIRVQLPVASTGLHGLQHISSTICIPNMPVMTPEQHKELEVRTCEMIDATCVDVTHCDISWSAGATMV